MAAGRARYEWQDQPNYNPDAPAMDAARVRPAANSLLVAVELAANVRSHGLSSEARAEKIVQLARDYARRLAGSPSAWPAELKETDRG